MRILLFLAAWIISGSAACAADAVPATAYFPVLPFDAPPDVTPQFVPVAANHPLAGVHAGMSRAIIVIHDETRDANAALATMAALAGTANTDTMIVAPQFLLSSDLVRFTDRLPEKGRAFASWQFLGWAMGDDSNIVPAQKSVSTFTVVDLLLMYLADRQAFPDLQTIVVAGYGAGANFTQRYAAFTLAADAVARQRIDLRFVVADASSFLYLTPNRPLGGRNGFGRPDPAACPDYNNYPYGLDNLNAYTRRVGANAAKMNDALRFITYINGTTPDAAPESNCSAMAQGKDSGARAANYALYLQSLYGDVAEKTQTFITEQNARNDAVGLFGSACGMEVLFGDGLCPHKFGVKQ